MSITPAFRKQSRTRSLLFLFSVTAVLLVIGLINSLKWGQAPVTWQTLYEAVTYQGHDKSHLYIQTLRLPRAIMAGITGAQLALAGLLTQLATKNPLASPHIFGIKEGAALAGVFGLIAVPNFTHLEGIAFAFFGAAFGALLVWSLSGGGTGSKTYVRLALAGITIHFLLSSLTEGLIIFNQQATDSMIFWLVGSLSQVTWPDVQLILPFFIVRMLLLGLMIPSLRLLLVDDEVAAGLGQRIAIVRGISMMLVILLAGSAVALCGPIGFVCLIVPHIARALAGGIDSADGADGGRAAHVCGFHRTLRRLPVRIACRHCDIGHRRSFLHLLGKKARRCPMSLTVWKRCIPLLIAFLIMILLVVISIRVGAVSVPFSDIGNTLLGETNKSYFIVHDVRLPRIVVGILAGFGLAVGGVILQSLVRNPLASPDVIGITKGAGFTAAAVIFMFPKAPGYVLPIAAFGGAFTAYLILLALSRRLTLRPSSLALIGIAVGTVFQAGIQYLIVRQPNDINMALLWMSGSLWSRRWHDVYSLLPWIVVLLPVAWRNFAQLNMFQLGDEIAASLGLQISRERFWLLLLLAVALAGISVSAVGSIGFIGLIAPHIAHSLVGGRHQWLIPLAALVGADLILLGDAIGRILIVPW